MFWSICWCVLAVVRRMTAVSPGRSIGAAWLPRRSVRSRNPACAGPAKVSRSEILYRLILRRLGGRGTLPLFALLEPITLAIHLQDVDVMREPVEQRAGEPLGGKDAGPFVKGQIAGHQGRAALVALTEHLKQQFGAAL